MYCIVYIFRLCDLHDAIDAEMNTSLCAMTQPCSVGDYVMAKFPLDEK